jgi:MerR family transcriptional regulator, light-induced transcriptional regulator
MNQSASPALSISAVERETGLSKDVLRKWEARYGFPSPLRDSQGERAYPPAQVDRLRLIKRLMDAGMRPSRLVSESDETLHALTRSSVAGVAKVNQERVESFTLDRLRKLEPEGVRQSLYRELLRHGIEHFVLDTLAPLNFVVGEAWARGELGIHEEHVYTEAVQGLLREATSRTSDVHASPRVLLTTLPEEQHGLGILMLAALLTQRDAYCISLGTQMPVQDIVEAVQAHRIDIVVLSFSSAYPQRRIAPALTELRQRLAPDSEIWAGGAGCARLHSPMAGIFPMLELEQALMALEAWREKNAA